MGRRYRRPIIADLGLVGDWFEPVGSAVVGWLADLRGLIRGGGEAWPFGANEAVIGRLGAGFVDLRVDMNSNGEPRHGGEYLRRLRERAGMTLDQVAERARVDPGWLAEVEEHGTEGLLYGQILGLVRATQPPRPEWWDEGHEHDLLVGPDGYPPPRTVGERRYWARVEAVRWAIRRQYRRGRAVTS